MNKTDLENIIQEFQNLNTESEKESFLEKQKEKILAQNKEETLEGLESIKNKLKEISLKQENSL